MGEGKAKVVILYQVQADHFVAGFEVVDGKIEHAAPILTWANGKTSREFWRYAKRKGWEIKEVAMYSRSSRSMREGPSGIESHVAALAEKPTKNE